MTSALDAIRAYNGQQGPRCSIGIFLSNNPALADTVIEALADPTIQTRAIITWLRREHDIGLSYDALRRHNRGECGCE